MSGHEQQKLRNTIVQATCELRFPTLPGLVSDLPRAFMKSALKAYPHHVQTMGVAIDFANDRLAQVERPTHKFTSIDGAWTCWLSNHALGLETKTYDSFEDFLVRLKALLDVAEGVLDTDFFTRVGLRYINALPPASQEELLRDEWLNEVIAAPLRSNPLGQVDEAWNHTKGRLGDVSYSFRHGIAMIADAGRRYVIDTDFFVEVVPWDDVIPQLMQFRAPKNDFFQWVIGPRTRQHLAHPATEA